MTQYHTTQPGALYSLDSLASLTGINTPTIFDIRTDREKDFNELTWRFSGEFFSPSAGQLSNNRIAFTPELEATLLARYVWYMANGGDLSLQGDIQYTGEIYFQPTNVAHLHEDAYTLFNASVKYNLPGDKWSFTVFGKNLTEKEYFTSGYDLGPPFFPSHRRTLSPLIFPGVQARRLK